MTSAIFL